MYCTLREELSSTNGSLTKASAPSFNRDKTC